MLVGGRLLLYLILIWSSSLLLNTNGDILNNKERQKRHIFPLLSYLHGYKIGQNFALQLPPFVLSPVIIIPVNQQQSVNIQKSGTGESFQENGGTFQTNLPVKLTLNSSVEDIESNLKTTQENINCTLQGDATGINDTFRQINVKTESSTKYNTTIFETGHFTSTTDNLETSETGAITVQGTITTSNPMTISAMSGFYPAPTYYNENLNSLQLTTSSTEATLGNPSLADKEQKDKPNNADIETSETEKIENKLLESSSSKVFSVHLATERYFRPNTRYYNPHLWHNAMFDQSSITTKSYTEKEKESPLPPQYDDRWRRFSSLSKVVLPASGFKPLAGLYYDGFLHKSLPKKNGFVPFDKYYFD